jgi:hypothetical protein
MSIWRLPRDQAEIGTLPSGANLRGWIGAAEPARDLLRRDIARHS